MLERAIAMSLEVEEEPFSIEGEFLKKTSQECETALTSQF